MELNDNSLMPWGKYKGYKMIDVPYYYLLWLKKENIPDKNSGVFNYIEENLNVLLEEEKKAKNKTTNYDRLKFNERF